MSLKNSINKLRQAMAASVDQTMMGSNTGFENLQYSPAAQNPDGSWKPECCITINLDSPNNPRVTLYCKGKIVAFMPLNGVPKNAKMCASGTQSPAN